MKKISALLSSIIVFKTCFCLCQTVDSTHLEIQKWSFHAQSTTIGQLKPSFNAKYTDTNYNSLSSNAESDGSQTATLYFDARLWKNATVYFNPEIAGGSGLSKALGLASASNGETYRVGDPRITYATARLFAQQIFPLGENKVYSEGDLNELKGYKPEKYIQLTVGKISLADFFDANEYAHDPRTQFSSWALFGNGAWDYPADVRGYTPSAIVEFISPTTELRGAISLLPLSANANDMNWRFWESQGITLELTKHLKLNDKPWNVRVLVFNNTAGMGNYNQAITEGAVNKTIPDIISTRSLGRTKYGFGISTDWQVKENVGVFARTSWSDGNNETWAFTEIDRCLSGGVVLKGAAWSRKTHDAGLAFVVSGLSDPHKNYLLRGGEGFIIGDGALNYAPEVASELYYGIYFFKNIVKLTGFYQLFINPAYNADRGPVNVFSLRLHIEK